MRKKTEKYVVESSFLTSDLCLMLAVSLFVKGTLKDSDNQRSGPNVLSHFFRC